MAHTPLLRKLKYFFHQANQLNSSTNQESSIIRAGNRENKWKRRRFLRLAALAGGSTAATTAFPLLQSTATISQFDKPKIAIIGGGIAGLNTAYQLQKLGLTATVYEAKTRIGGRIHSVEGKLDRQAVLELGASFINTDHEDILNLVEEFDLKLFNRAEYTNNSPFPGEGYFFNGKLHTETEIAEKLRPLATQIANDHALIDDDFARYAPDIDRLSVTQYLDQHADKIPEPFIRNLIENTIRTEYGVEPQESSALQLLYNLPTVEEVKVEMLSYSDEAYLVEGGNSKIIEGLAKKLSGQIETKKCLLAITEHQTGNLANKKYYELVFADKSRLNADYVVFAIPFSTLRQINLQIELPPTLNEFTQQLDLGKNEKVFAEFERQIWRQEKGFAGAVWSDLGFSQAWDSIATQQPQDHGVLTFYFGGKEVTDIKSQSLISLGNNLVDRFEQIISGAKSAATGKFFHTNWTNEPLLKGSYTNWKPGQYTKFSQFLWIESENLEESQDVMVDNLVFIGEHLSDEFYSFMNGAAQTGRLAAQAIARSIHESNMQ